MATATVTATPDSNPPKTQARVVNVTATPDPLAGQLSSAQVYPPVVTATPESPGNATPSAAVVKYPGPQITATPDMTPHPDGFWGHFFSTVHHLANVMGPPSPPSQPRGSGSLATVPDKSVDPGGGAGAIGSVQTPQLAPPQQDPNALAVQMFFTNTIAPYLDKLRGSMGENAQMAGDAMRQIQPNVNPALRPFFNPERTQAQTQTLADALAASTAAGPSYEQLIGQINNAYQAQRYAAYQAMKAQAAQQGGGMLGSLLTMMQNGGGGNPFTGNAADGGNNGSSSDFAKQIGG